MRDAEPARALGNLPTNPFQTHTEFSQMITQLAPYALVVTYSDGRKETLERGHDPLMVREAHKRVSRNPKAIARVELVDSSGPLETIWAAAWAALRGINPSDAEG